MGIREDCHRRCYVECNCCVGCSKVWLYGFSVVLCIFGTVLLISGLINTGKDAGDELLVGLGSAGLKLTILGGIGLMLTGGVGILAIKKKSRKLMILSLFFNTLWTIIILTSGLLLLLFINDLGNVGEEQSGFVDTVESKVNDLFVAIFNKCCSTELAGFTVGNGDEIPRLVECDAELNNLDACFVLVEQYEDALAQIDEFQLCEQLEKVDNDGVPLVGNPDEFQGACGNGQGIVFKVEFTQFVEGQLIKVGVIVTGVGLVLLLNLVATVIVTCANPELYGHYHLKYNDHAKPAGNGYVKPPNGYNGYNNNGPGPGPGPIMGLQSTFTSPFAAKNGEPQMYFSTANTPAIKNSQGTPYDSRGGYGNPSGYSQNKGGYRKNNGRSRNGSRNEGRNRQGTQATPFTIGPSY